MYHLNALPSFLLIELVPKDMIAEIKYRWLYHIRLLNKKHIFHKIFDKRNLVAQFH